MQEVRVQTIPIGHWRDWRWAIWHMLTAFRNLMGLKARLKGQPGVKLLTTTGSRWGRGLRGWAAIRATGS